MGRTRELFHAVSQAQNNLNKSLIDLADDRGHRPGLAFFASARLREESIEYRRIKKACYKYGRYGFDGWTGGGPGGMQAANEGFMLAKERLGGEPGFLSKSSLRSGAASLTLPHESETNPHVEMDFRCPNFPLRLTIFKALATCFVVGESGGVGTGFEGFDIMQHGQIFTKAIRTNSTEETCRSLYPLHPSVREGYVPPLIFVGTLWHKLKEQLNEMAARGYVSWEELKFVYFVDNYEDSYPLVRGAILSWRRFLRNKGIAPVI